MCGGVHWGRRGNRMGIAAHAELRLLANPRTLTPSDADTFISVSAYVQRDAATKAQSDVHLRAGVQNPLTSLTTLRLANTHAINVFGWPVGLGMVDLLG